MPEGEVTLNDVFALSKDISARVDEIRAMLPGYSALSEKVDKVLSELTRMRTLVDLLASQNQLVMPTDEDIDEFISASQTS